MCFEENNTFRGRAVSTVYLRSESGVGGDFARSSASINMFEVAMRSHASYSGWAVARLSATSSESTGPSASFAPFSTGSTRGRARTFASLDFASVESVTGRFGIVFLFSLRNFAMLQV